MSEFFDNADNSSDKNPLKQNYFKLFDLDIKFDIDQQGLHNTFLEKISNYHPDKHIRGGKETLDKATASSALINKAYNTLSDPTTRAEYILELHGHKLEDYKNLPQSFLMESFMWREQLGNIKEIKECNTLLSSVEDKQQKIEETLYSYVRDEQYDKAIEEAVTLRFIKRFKGEINQKIESLL